MINKFNFQMINNFKKQLEAKRKLQIMRDYHAGYKWIMEVYDNPSEWDDFPRHVDYRNPDHFDKGVINAMQMQVIKAMAFDNLDMIKDHHRDIVDNKLFWVGYYD